MLLDIQEQYFPQFFDELELQARKEIYPDISKRSTTLLTISDFCREGICEKFNIELDKVKTIYLAAQSIFYDKISYEWSGDPLYDEFYLFPASTYLHKNHELIVDLMSELKLKGAHLPNFIFTGHNIKGGFNLECAIKARGLDKYCRFYENVPPSQLKALYQRAKALVFPTLFEGFCIPIIEAQLCHCPVICSNLPVLREISGDCALFFDPNNLNSLEGALNLLSDGEKITQLATMGHENAMGFSWSKSAELISMELQKTLERFSGNPAVNPSIVIVLRLSGAEADIWRSLQSIIDLGYPKMYTYYYEDSDAISDGILDVLSSCRLSSLPCRSGASDYMVLKEAFDLSGADYGIIVDSGNILQSSFIDSFLWCCSKSNSSLAFLGEAFEIENGDVNPVYYKTSSYGDSSLTGYLYSEMLIYHKQVIEQCESLNIKGDKSNFRHSFYYYAVNEKKVFVSRRAFSECNPGGVTNMERVKGVLQGASMSRNNGFRSMIFILNMIERPARKLYEMIPSQVGEIGKRIWYKLYR
ncbi:MAG: glycosyltransferase family 4 protein [Planctomycetes bacterium]|nr:glycosyltransferase family 4 protein [Planctomycetota bacterium]